MLIITMVSANDEIGVISEKVDSDMSWIEHTLQTYSPCDRTKIPSVSCRLTLTTLYTSAGAALAGCITGSFSGRLSYSFTNLEPWNPTTQAANKQLSVSAVSTHAPGESSTVSVPDEY